jgi:predicted nucleic acid-binding protein
VWRSCSRGARQRTLRIWLEQELPTFFAGRVLPIDGAVAHRWGQLMAKLERPLPAIDSLLVATALEHNLVLISRNLNDVADLPVAVANPWDPRSSPKPAGESGICTGMSCATALPRKA